MATATKKAKPKEAETVAEKPEYVWRKGRHLKADPQAAGEEIARLRKLHGEALTTAHIVEAAQNPASPLHDCFEWDDAEAARKYRQQQARYLLSSILVVVKQAGGPTRYEITNVNVRTEDGVRAYVPTSSVVGNPSYREQVLTRALRDFDSWRARYAHVSKILGHNPVEIFDTLTRELTLEKAKRGA